MKEIDNKNNKSDSFVWYSTEGCTFTAIPENGQVRMTLKCRSECVHPEVTVLVGFEEFSSLGLRRIWSDELKETAFGRRNCEQA